MALGTAAVLYALAAATARPLTDPVLDTYPGRVAGYLAWFGAGAWLVSR